METCQTCKFWATSTKNAPVGSCLQHVSRSLSTHGNSKTPFDFGCVLYELKEECAAHEWVEKTDSDLGTERTEVFCRTCFVCGERDDSTGEVFFPAT